MHHDQQTIKHFVSCVGIGLHSGKMVSLSLYPATANSGIVFIRTDIHTSENRVLARYNTVTKTRLGTTISNEAGIEVATIEHLMAAFYGCNIDNAIVEVDGPEIPIMDGSALPFVKMLECAGVNAQDAPRKYLEVLQEIRVEDKDSMIRIAPGKSFAVSVAVDFSHKAIAKQAYSFSNKKSFRNELAKARTFGFKHEGDALRKAGLARGASLENVIVVGPDKILNAEGLRYSDEFARHKLLDLVGDFYLAGSPIKGQVTAVKPGHSINHKAISALLMNQNSYRFVE